MIIFNDAPSAQLRSEISTECIKLGIECIVVPPSVHSSDFPKRYLGEPLTLETRGIQSLQYALTTKGFSHDGIVMLIDSDMFLIKAFSAEEFLHGYHIAAVPAQQGPINYIQSCLVLIDMTQCPNKNQINFYPGRIGNVVVGAGGYMHRYFNQNPSIKLKPIDPTLSVNFALCTSNSCLESSKLCNHNLTLFNRLRFDTEQITFLSKSPRNIEFLCNNSFLHYRGGSNWDAKSKTYITKKTLLVRSYIENILAT